MKKYRNYSTSYIAKSQTKKRKTILVEPSETPMEGDINMPSDIPPNKSISLPENSTVDSDNTTTENISEVSLLAEELI